MTSPLVETKLHIPKLRGGLVARPRLSERLSRGTESRLTLISAPAGFGKTTLLAEWLAASSGKGSVAWLSLEQSDSQPASFWTYVITALQTAVPGVGAGALAHLQSVQSPLEPVLATLLNELSALPNDVVLVLDDYHLVDGHDIHDGLAFLLEHLPPHVHLVISTRADPALPLARLRARGELVEIRAADLRFRLEEVAAYLNEAVGLDLAAKDIAALEERTEGWIAALQLAALSMQGRDDIGGFIAAFAGDDRYIVDYLVEEVLQRQPEQVRTFLRWTCLLSRLSGPLCDAVTGQHGGKAMLEALDSGNLFVIPLDDTREWYRYHHLFADVLQAHLLYEQPDRVPYVHRRASHWYEQNGEPFEAIRHALAAKDFERAAGLVELAIPDLRRRRQEAIFRGWVEMIPDELVRGRPVLNVTFAGALMLGGEFEGVEGRLQEAERLLETATGDRERPRAPSAAMVVVNDAEVPRLPGAIEMYRAALALARGDVPGTLRHGQRAIDLALEEDDLGRAGPAGLMGLAFWGSGDLEAAHRAYSACAAGLYRAGHVADVLGCSIALADLRITQGRLGEARRTYEHALQLAATEGGTMLRGTADMYVGLSELAFERDDLPAARRHLLHSQELGEYTALPQNRYRWRVAMARVQEGEGDLKGAVDLLNEAERLYAGDFFPNVRPVPALRARVWVAQGDVGAALGWAREQGLTGEDDLSYMREFEHITLARVLLARHATEHAEHSLHEATRLLHRLLAAAENGKRTGSVLEILVLQALARHAHGDIAGAGAPLERALALAEPEGYVRLFVGWGPPLAALLKAVAKQGTARTYVRRLLVSCGRNGDTTPVRQGLVDALSERELDVLRMLATELDGPDIARELMVSLNTMRTHTKSIFAKLGVNSRRAAVRQGRALNLMSRTRDH